MNEHLKVSAVLCLVAVVSSRGRNATWKMPIIYQYWRSAPWAQEVSRKMKKVWLRYTGGLTSLSLTKALKCKIQEFKSFNLLILRTIELKIQKFITCSKLEEHNILATQCLGIATEKVEKDTAIFVHTNIHDVESFAGFDGLIELTVNKLFNINITFLYFRLSLRMKYYSKDSRRDNPSFGLKGFHTYSKLIVHRWDLMDMATRTAIFEYFSIYDPCSLFNCKTKMHGSYPAHSRYLLDNKNKISWRLHPMWSSGIAIFYQIFDDRLIKEFIIYEKWMKKRQRNFHGVDLFLFQELQFRHAELYKSCAIYKIVTDRIKTIKIFDMFSKNIGIFNGPDINSPQLNHLNMPLITSTFQACIILHNPQTEAEIFNGSSQFESILAPGIEEIIVHQNGASHYRYPKEKCEYTEAVFCIIKASSPQPFAINLTILSMRYRGPAIEEHKCTYGGITIQSRDAMGRFSQLFMECNHEHDDTELPSLFSPLNTNEMWITIYSYQIYSEIQLEFKIEASVCKGIEVKGLLMRKQITNPQHQMCPLIHLHLNFHETDFLTTKRIYSKIGYVLSRIAI